MLEVKKLIKEFEKTTAVDSISFSTAPGRIFGLLGPNGAGKTTTIRTILNIIKPTSGEILLDGKPLTTKEYHLTGYLPEERGLYKKAKVMDLLGYFGELNGISQAEAKKRGKHWLKRLEISHYEDRKIEELSKGNQQKVQFIASVIHDPLLLVLDEPFSGFDPINQELIKNIILEFNDAGKYIILSTHQMETAEKLCRDIFLLNKGREIAAGPLDELKRRFGGRQVRLEYSGDTSVLKTHPAVAELNEYQNYAELTLVDEATGVQFIRDVSQKLDVSHFSVTEPTLQKIFVDLMREKEGVTNE